MNREIHTALLLRCIHAHQIHQIQARLTTAGLLHSDVLLYNTLIRAHTQTPTPQNSIPLYVQIRRCALSPDAHTFPYLLKACSLIPAQTQGFSVHAQALKFGFDSCLFVNNALIHFYSVTGGVIDARGLLDGGRVTDPVSYNTMISGYVRVGELDNARKLFDVMPVRNVVSWTAMISGYVQSGFSKEGLELFSRMQTERFEPCDATLVSVLCACAHLGALEQGKWVHGYLKSNRTRISVFLGTSLIDMYAKCGEVDLCLAVFNEMGERNVLAWTAVIKGLAMHGRAREALRLFSEMEKSGVMPDDIAFLGALSACTHAGMIEHGRQIFGSMNGVYGLKPKIEHYGCMVDLLARGGLLNEAMDLVESLPTKPDAVVWSALMAGCRLHGNVELAEKVINHLIQLEPDSSAVYVLLANIYASSGKHEEARNVRLMMKTKGVEKTPGCSLVAIGGTMHQFMVGDTSHPQIDEIMVKWEEIERLVKLEGYVPNKKDVLIDLDEEEKEELLASHSEKLAIAFALISTRAGMVIRIVKNLRVCSDCHHVTKLISKVYDREIVVRDKARFHHFKGGRCSCNDYW